MFFLIFCLSSFIIYHPVSAGALPMKRLAEVEKVLYGHVQEGSIVKRIERIEETLYNKIQDGTLIERVEKSTDYVLPAADKPSLIFLINTLEWSLTNDVTQGTIVNRLQELEKVVFGKTKSDPLVKRVSKLAELSLPEGKVPAEQVVLPANTLIRIKTLSKISSSGSQVGARVSFEVVNDVKVDGKLLIPDGTNGFLKIKDIDEAGKIGKDADVKLEFSRLMAIDGSRIDLKLDKKAQEENRSRELAVGASLLGAAILGPLGLIAGYFVEGKEKDIPAGTELYIQTVNQKKLYGLNLN